MGETKNNQVKLLKKIHEIQVICDFFKKSATGDTGSHKYKYVEGSAILSKIREKMDKINLLLEMQLCGESKIIDKKLIIPCEMVWVDVETTEERRIPWILTGQDTDIAKAFGKGATYCQRYFQLKYFNIPTDEDDPDNIKNTPKNESKTTSKSASNDNQTTGEKMRFGDNKGKDVSEVTDLAELMKHRGWATGKSNLVNYIEAINAQIKKIEKPETMFKQPPEGDPVESDLEEINAQMEAEYQRKLNG